MIETGKLEKKINQMLEISTDGFIIFSIESILREEFEEMLDQLDDKQSELGSEKYVELRRRLLKRTAQLKTSLNRFVESSSFREVQKLREEQLEVWQTDNFEKRLGGFFIKSARLEKKQEVERILRDEFDPLLIELTLRQDELGEKKYGRYQRDLWERKGYLSALLRLMEQNKKIPRKAQIEAYAESRLRFVPDPFSDKYFPKQKQEMKTALTKVLSKIWDEAKDGLYPIKQIFLGQTAFIHWIPPALSVLEGSAPSYIAHIYLPESLLFGDPAYIHHVIAHEIAHGLRQHELPSSKLSEDEKQAEADDMARSWGFPRPPDMAPYTEKKEEKKGKKLKEG